MNHTDLVTLCHAIHAENVERGWWTDLTTGTSILATRNRPEMMMLAVSEIAEAWQADGPDDKLPQYHGFDVEVADCAIRLGDLLGAEAVTGAHFHSAQTLFCQAPVARGADVVVAISNALEHYRKGRLPEYRAWLCRAMLWCLEETDMGIVQAKRTYNGSRQDHSRAARMAPDGKKI